MDEQGNQITGTLLNLKQSGNDVLFICVFYNVFIILCVILCLKCNGIFLITT